MLCVPAKDLPRTGKKLFADANIITNKRVAYLEGMNETRVGLSTRRQQQLDGTTRGVQKGKDIGVIRENMAPLTLEKKAYY
jgi:hypothetical protein